MLSYAKLCLGEDHPETLSGSSTYWNQARWTEAEEMHLPVMEMEEKGVEGEYPDTLTSMNSLAITMKDQGRNEDAFKIIT